MLPRKDRLNLKKEFKLVAAGKQINTVFAKLFVRFGENKTPLVGISTSAKVFKGSVERNRARRVLATAIKTLYPSLPGRINIVALPKAGVSKVKSGDVLLDLEDALKKAKII